MSAINGYTKEMHVRIQQNEAEDYTGLYMYAPATSYSYKSVGKTDVDMYTAQGNTFAVAYIELDSKYISLSRNVFTMSDFFALFGGMKEMLLWIGGSIVCLFQNNLYIGSLISRLYMVDHSVEQREKLTEKLDPKMNRKKKKKIEEEKFSNRSISAMNSEVSFAGSAANIEVGNDKKQNEIKEALKDRIANFKQFKLRVVDAFYMGFGLARICAKRSKAAITFKNFTEGGDKIIKELDIITLIENLRKTTVLTKAMMNKRQRLLCKYQKINILGIPEEEPEKTELKKPKNKSAVVPTIECKSDPDCECQKCIEQMLDDF